MKLKEFKRSRSKLAMYSSALADAGGNRDYELTISGNRSTVERVFEKTDFDVSIDAHASAEEFEARSREFWSRRVAKQESVPTPGPPTVEAVSRRVPPPVPKNSVVVCLRRIRGEGTFWTAWVTPIYVPVGVSVFFVMPRVWACWGITIPYSGNPNLFLHVGSPATPPVSTSIALGAVSDSVGFTGTPLPWTHFAGWFRILGAAPGTVTLFGMVGHSIP